MRTRCRPRSPEPAILPLAAFLAAIDGLVKEGLVGRLEDATQIVYVSPLKALSNDIRRKHRRHAGGGARRDAPLPAAHRRHEGESWLGLGVDVKGAIYEGLLD